MDRGCALTSNFAPLFCLFLLFRFDVCIWCCGFVCRLELDQALASVASLTAERDQSQLDLEEARRAASKVASTNQSASEAVTAAESKAADAEAKAARLAASLASIENTRRLWVSFFCLLPSGCVR